jgi:hypothetical protein
VLLLETRFVEVESEPKSSYLRFFRDPKRDVARNEWVGRTMRVEPIDDKGRTKMKVRGSSKQTVIKIEHNFSFST